MTRFLVAQVGPRRHYAVAAVLDEAGLLDRMYTDLSADLGVGRWLSLLGGFCNAPPLRRLQGRRLSAGLVHKTRAFSWPALRYELDKVLAGANRHEQERALAGFGERLGRSMAQAGFGRATHLYTMLGDVTPLLRQARRGGVVTVTEIYVILTGELIVAAERQKFPGFEMDPPSELLDAAFEWLREVIELSDWLVVPSEAVRDDLLRNFGVDEARCLLVPYAASDRFFEVENRPIPGRVLFAGTAGLRKGVHTLGEAALALPREEFSFRVAGGVSDAVRRHALTRQLLFLGRIPRVDMIQEYERADVFVLPSLAEGSAEVTYEALAAGIPVVTTAEAGSVVRDGIEGFIVSASDPETVAARVRQIVEDRALRDRMAFAARERARNYTWAKYRERLATALSNLPRESKKTS